MMLFCNRRFKTRLLRCTVNIVVVLLVVTVISYLFDLIIVDSDNEKAIAVGEQEFSSSLGDLRPFDIPVVVENAPSRIKGDLVRLNGKALTEDDDDDESGKDRRARPVDDENSVVNDNGGNVGSVPNRVQINKLEQRTLDHSLLNIKEKMIDRQNHIHKACSRLGMRKLNLDDPDDLNDVIAHKGNLDTLFWNDKFKFITSVIFKCGSDNWRKFLAALAAKQGSTVRNFPSKLQNVHSKPTLPLSRLSRTPQKIQYRLKNYLKIVTVRHPLIRFISCYRDKFIEHTDRYRKDIPKMIVDSRNDEARAPEVRASDDAKRVTFSDFAEFVTRKPTPVYNESDPHWTPQHVRSRPCQHKYDIIAKLETSDEDMDFIKRVIGVDDNLLFGSEYKDRHKVSHNETLFVSYYQQLSEEVFQKVCDYYRLDFELYGYYRPKNLADVARVFDDFF